MSKSERPSYLDVQLRLSGNGTWVRLRARYRTHCAAGKDRTGVAVALVLHALGVRADDILADYLRSSPAQRAHDGGHLHRMERMTREAAGVACTPEMVEVLLDARPEWLRAAIASAAESYGSVERYLEVNAGLDAAALSRLRDAWLS